MSTNPSIWNQFVWDFYSWVFFLSIWHCYCTFYIQITAEVDFCYSCKKSTSLNLATDERHWAPKKWETQPKGPAVPRLRVCPILQGRQCETAAGIESSFLNHRTRLLLLLPHCLRHMPSSTGKKGVMFCTEEVFTDCTVLTRSQGTICTVHRIKQGSGEGWWKLPGPKYFEHGITIQMSETAYYCNIVFLTHVCIP